MGKLVWISLLALSLSGCGTRVYVRTEVDPDYAPKAQDPIAVVLPDNSSIEDRRVAAAAKQQMTSLGFSLVDVAHAKWVLGIGTHENTVFLGTQSSAFAFYNMAFGQSEAKYEDRVTLQFWLFQGDAYRNGKTQAVWGATEIIKDADSLSDDPGFYTHPLLMVFGKNYRDESVRPGRVTQNDGEP